MAVYDPLDGDELLTPREVARLMRVDPRTVTRWATSGQLPSMKTPGGRTRIRRSAVEALLNP